MLDRFHRMMVNRPQRGITRLHGLAVQGHGTSPAVPNAATKPNTFAIQLLSQGVEQWRLVGYVDGGGIAVKDECGQIVYPVSERVGVPSQLLGNWTAFERLIGH